MAQVEFSPITGIIEEDQVFVDFGEHEGKSVLELADTLPDYYSYLCDQKREGRCAIRRSKEKIFRLYISTTLM